MAVWCPYDASHVARLRVLALGSTGSRRESAAWLAEHGVPADPPEAFRVDV